MADMVVLMVMFAVVFFAGYMIGGRKRSSASAGASPTRERGAITHTSVGADQGAIYGYGVWHSEDGEWIGFGVTSSIAAELVPEGVGYKHLWLRPVVAHIVANDLTSEEPDA